MTDRLSAAKEMLALSEKATAEPWGFYHRWSGFRGEPPRAGVDASGGLGWDWQEDEPFNVPPEPNRGTFALGADAAFISRSRTLAPLLASAVLEMAGDIERLKEALAAAHPAVTSEESNSSGNPWFESSQKRRSAFWRVVQHTHLGIGGDENCQRCGENFRHEIHARASESQPNE